MKRRYFIGAVAIAVSNVQASGIPTVDIANIVQTTRSALENIQQTMNQYEQIANQVQQIRNQVKQLESMTGHYGMGELLKGQLDQLLRNSQSETWEETLAIYESGGLPGHREAYEQAQAARAAGENYTANELYMNPNSLSAKNFENNAKRIYATMGVSRETYNQNAERLGNIVELNDTIEKTPNTKAAIDLNNRLNVENAVLLNELLLQLTVLNIQQSEQRELEHNRAAGDLRMADPNIPNFGGNGTWLTNHN